MAESTSSLCVSVYDGARKPIANGTDLLCRAIDGNQQEQYSDFKPGPTITLTGLPFYDNFGDNYACIVSADGFRQSGFRPLKLSPKDMTTIDLMLLPGKSRLNFSGAAWNAISARWPLLANGVSAAEAQKRYEDLRDGNQNIRLAALFNILTAMEEIHLPHGKPLDYIKQIQWDQIAQDRFFAYCDPQLVSEVRTAAAQGAFAKELLASWLHPGATASWKQVQFGEANVQLTFHEKDTAVIDGKRCVVVEPDIDYYRDAGAHFLLEGAANYVTGGLTNPETVYVLRWIAGCHAGVAAFNPPYTIEAQAKAAN